MARAIFPTPQSAATDDEGFAQQVGEMVSQVRAEFRERDLLYQTIDNILFRALPVAIPDAYRKTALEVHSPLALHIANTVTAALSINPPACQFQPVGFGSSYQANATEREHFFDGSWRRQEEEAKRQLFRLFMYSLVTKGEAVLKTVERTKTAWSSYGKYAKGLQKDLDAPEGPYQGLDQPGKDQVYNAKTEEFKRGLAYPIRTSFVSPETFYYIKGEDGFTLAAEVKDVPYFDTLEKFGYALDAKGKVCPQAMGLPSANWSGVMGKAKNLTLLEVWNWQWVAYILIGPSATASTNHGALGKGTLVKKIKHGYGDSVTKTLRGPYFHAQGVTTDSTLPERAGLSILYGFLELFPLLDSVLTIRSNAAFFTGFPSFKRTQHPGVDMPPAVYGRDGSETDTAQSTLTPGTIYPYDIEPIQLPAAGPEFAAFITDLRSMLELALPSNVQGVVAGDQSGYALNQAAYLARLAWDPIVANAEIALAERIGFESWLIENRIRESVYVWGEAPPDIKKKGTKGGWLGMGPADLKGVHRYKVALNPQTPSNRVIEVRTHQELLALRLETRDQAITDLGGSPDEVERWWLLDDLKQDPAIKAALKARVFQQLATIDQAALGGQAAMAQAVGGGPGQPMMPGGPPGAPGQLPDVFQPGQGGQPLQAQAPGQAPPGGGMPSMPGGMPGGVPNPPPNAQPLPGQGR